MTTEERREEWAKALESGVYRQDCGVLRSKDDGYCCLGVACDLFKEETSLEWESYHHCFLIDDNSATLPYELQVLLQVSSIGKFAWSSLSEETQEEIKKALPKNIPLIQDSLVDLNDTGVPFSLIARVVREAGFIYPYHL